MESIINIMYDWENTITFRQQFSGLNHSVKLNKFKIIGTEEITRKPYNTRSFHYEHWKKNTRPENLETIFKQFIEENKPNLEKRMPCYMQKSYRISTREDEQRSSSWNIIYRTWKTCRKHYWNLLKRRVT